MAQLPNLVFFWTQLATCLAPPAVAGIREMEPCSKSPTTANTRCCTGSNLYGTAQRGGAEALGTVFVLSPARQLEVLHSFEGLEDGAFPVAGVIRDAAGNLYGTTVRNFLLQRIQGGSVFEITP
jgi:uncharacterized repeat protein (TIGR03803 family)